LNKFIDKAIIKVRSGKGGDGSVHLHREKYKPKGGPDGGDGGKGGDVIIIGDNNLSTLRDFKYMRKFIAENGGNGMGNNKHGKDGESVYIKVPPGTRVFDHEMNMMLFDILHHGEEHIAAYGGRGGRGNTHFKSSVRQVPLYAEEGKPGEEKILRLELLLIADVGLVGYPNAGKSTFLSAVSDAHPKIANYPFTTLIPNLGIYTDEKVKITFADIPGIIEGAHEGKGLGFEFLRHISRTSILLFIIDVTEDDPIGEYNKLLKELSIYDRKMINKKRVIAFNKIDMLEDKGKIEDLKGIGEKHFFISAKNKEGLNELLNYIKYLIYGK